MPLLPWRPSALVRRWCAAGQHGSRHDRCRLYATSEWHFRQRFVLWSNASNGRAANITVCPQDAAVCTRVKIAPDLQRNLPAVSSSCRRQNTTVLGSLLWRVAILSVCLQCFLSLDEAVWQQAVLDHHSSCTPCLPAPYYVGGYQSAGKQDSNSCVGAFLTLHNVSSVCLSHHESRMSCCRSTISSSSISSKKMKLHNHIKPPYLEIRVSR